MKNYIKPNCVVIDIDAEEIIANSKPNGNWKDEYTNPGGNRPPGHGKNSYDDEYRTSLWES